MKKTRKWIALLLLLVMAVSTYVVPVSAGEPCADDEHDWDAGKETTLATCEDSGEMTFTCSKCSETKTELIPAKGHTEVTTAAKDATCTEDGKAAETKCSVCNESLLGGETITKLGHDYGDPYFEWDPADYINGVKAIFICSRCGNRDEKNANVTSKKTGNVVSYTVTVLLHDGTTTYTYPYEVKEKEGEVFPYVEDGVKNESITALSGLHNGADAIESAMGQAIQNKAGYGGQKASHKLYDVELMIFKDDGWKVANENDFPEGGVEVFLEYPEGTTKDGYEFTVAHMFTHTMNGKYSVGQIEIPKVTKTDYGIEFTVNGLSPIMVAWTQTQGAAGTNAKGISGVPQTGDAANVGVLLLCMVVSVAVGVGVVIRKRNGRA